MTNTSLYQEKELLHRIAEGDQDAFTLLFEHYHPSIYGTALKLTSRAALAEDIVQDVFLKIWLKRSSLSEIEFFPAFLYKVAENTIYSALRKQYREKDYQHSLTQDANSPSSNETEDTVLQREYEQLLDHAIARLPEKQRQTYELIKRKGLKREEAAAQLQVSPETVKSNLDQAMRNIRAYCLAHTEWSLWLLVLLAGK